MDTKSLKDVPDSPMSAPKGLVATENLRDKTARDEPLNTTPSKKDETQPKDDTYQEQSTAKVALLIVSCLLSMFLVALDRTIISTAIPKITNDFNSLPDVGWYGSAYLLTCCAFQLLFGKLYTMYPVKAVLLSSILSFEIASAICGAATSSVMFIVGRAISGIGAAGIFAGTIVAITYAVPLQKRPMTQGLFGALFGLASVFGPLVGGAFTTNVSWRWCFYINLPFGGIAMVVIALFLVVPDRDSTKLPWLSKLLQLDLPGSAALIPGVVCILLALQWGGQTYAWGSSRIIALLTVGGVLLVSFVAIQILKPNTAMIPPRVFRRQRSVAFGLWATLCIGCSQYIYVYFLPIWFQSIKGVSSVQSGIRLLPLMLAMVAGSILGGATTGKIGYYVQYAIIGSALMSVGSGLLTTLQVDSGKGAWIGFQVLYGFGMGLGFQVPNLAVQAVLPQKDVPIGLALMFFGQLFGAAIIVSIGENVLDNQLIKRLAGIPGFNPQLVTSGGASDLIQTFAPQYRKAALIAYNEALRQVFYIGLVVSCLAVIGAVSLEWRSIKEEPKKEDLESAGDVQEN